MKRLQIKTAQNVIINFTLANVGQRLLAFLIDNILKFTYLFVVHYLLDLESLFKALQTDNWSERAIDILVFLPVTFYSLYTEILFDGQTIGKKFMNLKIINTEGFKPTITDFIIRWFLRIIDFNSFTLLFIYISALGTNGLESVLVLLFLFGKTIGFFLILFTKNHQRFGDIIANTTVIYLKDDVKFSDTILQEISTKYTPTYPNVIKLSDNDVRIIKSTYESAKNISDFKTLIKLRSKILEVTDIKSKHNSDSEFIDVILKDYNFYTQNM